MPPVGLLQPVARLLAVRDAMRRHASADTPVILLYPGNDNELGADVLARCAKRRAITHDLWQTVLTLFRAAHIDPRLARHRWLAELLVRFMPAEGYSPVRSLVLDQDRVRKELFRVVLGIENFPPSELDLLKWAGDAQRREQFKALEEVARNETLGTAPRLSWTFSEFRFCGHRWQRRRFDRHCDALRIAGGQNRVLGKQSGQGRRTAGGIV